MAALGAEGGFATACEGPFGSRVCEAALRRCDDELRRDYAAAAAALEEPLGAWCEGALGGALELLASRFGSHALRALLGTLRGYNVDADAGKGPQGAQGGKGGRGKPRLAEKLQGVARTQAGRGGGLAPHGGYPEMCGALVLELAEAAKPHMWEMQVHPAASPVLQAMLECARGEDASALAQLTATVLCAKEGKTNVEAVDKDGFMELCMDRSGSHLAEAALRCADEGLHGRVYRHLFRGRLAKFAEHGTANFVLQALLASERSEGQLGLLMDELEPLMPRLLPAAAAAAGGVQRSRAGVLAATVGACSRLRAHEKRVARGIAAALAVRQSVSDANEGADAGDAGTAAAGEKEQVAGASAAGGAKLPSEELVRGLLFLDGGGGNCSVLGCAMLAKVLGFPLEAAQRFVDGVAHLSAEVVARVAADRSGGRALEGLLSSTHVETSTKNKLVAKLEGRFAALAAHPHSCFTVERAFTYAGPKQREAIAAELFSARSSLEQTRFGSRLLQHCSVQAYGGGTEDWKAAQAGRARRQDQWEGIFGGEGQQQQAAPGDGAAVAQAGAGGGGGDIGNGGAPAIDATREAAQALGGKRLDGAMEALGFGRKGKGKGSSSRAEQGTEREEGKKASTGKDDIDAAFKGSESGKRKKDKEKLTKEERRARKEAKRKRKEEAEEPQAHAGSADAPHDDSLANVLAAVEKTKPKKKKKKSKAKLEAVDQMIVEALDHF